MKNSFKHYGVKCSGDENERISYKINEALHQLNMFWLPLYFFFLNTVESQYYLCGRQRIILIEKSPADEFYMWIKPTQSEHRLCWAFLLFIIKGDEKKRHCFVNALKPPPWKSLWPTESRGWKKCYSLEGGQCTFLEIQRSWRSITAHNFMWKVSIELQKLKNITKDKICVTVSTALWLSVWLYTVQNCQRKEITFHLHLQMLASEFVIGAITN